MANWGIEINNFNGGFSPKWYAESYPSYGNKNQAGAMTNADISNPGYLTQGPGLTTLTNGTEAGAITTLIKGVTKEPPVSGACYGTGGRILNRIGSTAVVNTGSFPHTISASGFSDEDGEDVCHYKGNVYYSFNEGVVQGDIGIYDKATTFNDDWGSTVPSGAAQLQYGPHQIIVGGNDIMYIANGVYVASWDGTTFIPQALDLPTGAVVQSLAWNQDRLYIAANTSTLVGTNKPTASVYIWDTVSSSWETEIRLMGNVGALHNKNGTVFVWYRDMSDTTGGFKMGYINGAGITDIANYTGGVPAYYQVTDYKDFILWVSSDLIYAWGSGNKDLQVKLFQWADGGYSTVGGLVCPFGDIVLVASNQSTSYKVAKFSGYDVNSSWKSLMFDITWSGSISKIEKIRFNFEQLATGARVDWKLLNNRGETIYSDIISYAKLGAVTTAFYPLNGKVQENFRVELDYTNGDTTNTVKIKNCKIYGGTD